MPNWPDKLAESRGGTQAQCGVDGAFGPPTRFSALKNSLHLDLNPPLRGGRRQLSKKQRFTNLKTEILKQAWIALHEDELMADWKLAAGGTTPYKIEPLR